MISEKMIGETPLECLERTRLEKGIAALVPMTYAGRLDPLASGKLLILVGDECKEKEKYLGLDKEYEIEVLFGVMTDTGDALGLIKKVDETGVVAMSFFDDVYNVRTLSLGSKKEIPQAGVENDFSSKIQVRRGAAGSPLTKFCGKFTQVYSAYSSKTVGTRVALVQKSNRGLPSARKRQLHSLARSGELPDKMPTKEVEIYSIEELGKVEQPVFMNGRELGRIASENIYKVNGDFRQKEIIEGWKKFKEEYGVIDFPLIKLRVKCSSGTYMRSLAERIGKEVGTVAFAFSIKRTKIGNF